MMTLKIQQVEHLFITLIMTLKIKISSKVSKIYSLLLEYKIRNQHNYNNHLAAAHLS